MNDSDALLSKADALLCRLRSSAQDEFPILTEIVDLPTTTGASLEPASRPLDLKPNDVDVDDLCRHLRLQLTHLLEHSIRKWADEILHKKLEQELELALQESIERAVDAAREQMFQTIEEELSIAIDTEIRARIFRKD